MKYTIFTDPHIGTSRSSHTTRESSKRLKSQLTKAAQDIVSRGGNMICVGDLFDKAFNSEEVLLDGLDIASRCNYVLAGNHDLSNREGQITSIDFLSTLCESVIKCGKLSEPFFYPTDDKLMFVPHHASQEVFENALKLAYEHADDGDYLLDGKAVERHSQSDEKSGRARSCGFRTDGKAGRWFFLLSRPRYSARRRYAG